MGTNPALSSTADEVTSRRLVRCGAIAWLGMPLRLLLSRAGRVAMVGAPKRGDRIDREAILALLNESRPVTVTGLASALGVSRQAVQYHLRVLRLAGLVDCMERGPRSRWRTIDAVSSAPDPAGEDYGG